MYSRCTRYFCESFPIGLAIASENLLIADSFPIHPIDIRKVYDRLKMKQIGLRPLQDRKDCCMSVRSVYLFFFYLGFYRSYHDG